MSGTKNGGRDAAGRFYRHVVMQREGMRTGRTTQGHYVATAAGELERGWNSRDTPAPIATKFAVDAVVGGRLVWFGGARGPEFDPARSQWNDLAAPPRVLCMPGVVPGHASVFAFGGLEPGAQPADRGRRSVYRHDMTSTRGLSTRAESSGSRVIRTTTSTRVCGLSRSVDALRSAARSRRAVPYRPAGHMMSPIFVARSPDKLRVMR